MSVGYIYGNRRTSDYEGEGMIMRDALEAVRQYGDVAHEEFPYNEEVPKMIKLLSTMDASFSKKVILIVLANMLVSQAKMLLSLR
mgnify:CR=1 FL=1